MGDGDGDGETGEQKWFTFLGDAIVYPPSIGADGSLWIQTYEYPDASLFHLAAQDGEILLERPLPGSALGGVSPILTSDGVVYHLAGGIDGILADETLVFQAPTPKKCLSFARAKSGIFIAGCDDGFVVAVGTDESVLWTHQFNMGDFSPNPTAGFPRIRDNEAIFPYVGANRDIYYLAINPKLVTKSYVSSLGEATDRNVALGGFGDFYMGALQWTAARINKSNDTVDGSQPASPPISGELFDSWRGFLVVDAQENVYRIWVDGTLHAFTSGGALRWTYPLGGFVMGPVTIDAKGRIVAPTPTGLVLLGPE